MLNLYSPNRFVFLAQLWNIVIQFSIPGLTQKHHNKPDIDRNDRTFVRTVLCSCLLLICHNLFYSLVHTVHIILLVWKFNLRPLKKMPALRENSRPDQLLEFQTRPSLEWNKLQLSDPIIFALHSPVRWSLMVRHPHLSSMPSHPSLGLCFRMTIVWIISFFIKILMSHPLWPKDIKQLSMYIASAYYYW